MRSLSKRSVLSRLSALALIALSLNTLVLVDAAHAAPLPPGFSEVRLQVIADNDFAVFMGDDANATRLFFQNNDEWPTQIQEAAVVDVVPVAGETFLYIVAMGGSAGENWAGTINGKDIASYTGAQVAVNRAPIGLASTADGYLLVNNYFQGWATGGGSIVEIGTYPVSLGDLRIALTGAVWASGKIGGAIDSNLVNGGSVCCGGYTPSDGIPLVPVPDSPTAKNKGFSGKGWRFPSESAVVFRYPLSAAQLPVAPGNAQVVVDWNAPNGGEAPFDYLVDYKETSEPDASYKPFSVIPAPATIETVTGLTNGTSYTFRVAGRNSSGDVGAASVSRSVTPTGPASQPTNLSYAALNNSVSIGFTAPENNGGYSISNYQYSINNGSWVSRSPESVTAPIVISSGLSNAVSADIKLRAVTPYGAGTSSAEIRVIPGIVETRTLTYSSGTLGSVSGLASGATYYSNQTFTVAAGPTRSDFRFTGWKSGPTSYQPGDTYLVTDSNINLTAQWTQSSMYGLAAADKQQVLKWNITGNESIDTTVSGGGGSSVRVVIPSLAFDAGTEIIFWRILNQNIAKTAISNDNDYIVNMALSWSLGDDIATAKTVPIARSAIQMTITNNSIYAGAKAWQIIGGVPTLLGTATQDGTITVSFTNDPIVVAANFAIVAAPPTVEVTVLPPSLIKMIARPRISRSDSFITCNSGEYSFIRNARSEESLTAYTQVIRLLSNGLVVDSSTAIFQLAQFNKSDAYENSTLSCEVVVSQEGITSTQSSLDEDSIKILESEKVKQISQANYDYYKARDNAYLNRIEGSATSAVTWKKALEKAIKGREAQKVKAASDFIASLEEAGISILYITKAKEVTPEPALPVVEKEPPAANVQPSKAMKKIGTIYFATGTYFINDASKKVIKNLASVIAESDPSTLLSYGHTDNKGGTDNLLLSQNRAKAVARLIRSLLPDQKIKTGWYASTKPISSGSSKADLAKNRRVEIYVK
ncbi:OmpA-like domain [Candidatus Nanopelagicaceae bacterium]